MAITSDIASTSVSTALNTSKSTSADGAGDFQTFLTLLTAQMRNQDPLKPMDSTEFVAQLASFSAVEQQVQTNDQLTELIGLFSSSPSSTMADWIGKEVRHQGEASFDGNPVDIDVPVHPYADSATLSVKDSNGQVIYQLPFDPTRTSIKWSGETTSAGTAPLGRYTFEVESSLEGTVIASGLGSVYDLVTEVRMNNGSPFLIFADGTAMAAEDASSMRLPST